MPGMPTLRAHAVLVGNDEQSPVILVHGAANSGRVWAYWQDELARRGWDVVALARTLRQPPVLVGWSMGGLVAMMAAAACHARACVGLAPSAPTRTFDSAVPLRPGVFGPEEYGIVDRDPERQPAMADLDRDERVVALESLGRESRFARDERKAGVVIGDAPCPVPIVTGTADTQWPRERYDDLPFAADRIDIGGASHWGLVLNRRLLPGMGSAVTSWLEKNVRRGRP